MELLNAMGIAIGLIMISFGTFQVSKNRFVWGVFDYLLGGLNIVFGLIL